MRIVNLTIIMISFFASCSGCEKAETEDGLEIIWSTSIPAHSYSFATPGVSDSTVVFITGEGEFKGFSTEQGRQKWSTRTGLGRPAVTSVVAYGDHFYYDFFWRTLSINAETGAIDWVFTKNLVSNNNPEVTQDYVFTGDLDVNGIDGNVYCLDRTSGLQVWKNHIGERVNEMLAVPEINRVYVGTRSPKVDSVLGGIEYGHLFCLDMIDGHTLWSFDASYNQDNGFEGGGISGKPAVWSDFVFFTTSGGPSKGEVVCINKITGDKKWSTVVPLGCLIGLTIDADSKRGYGAANNIIFCIDLLNGQILWTKQGNPDARAGDPPYGTVFTPLIMQADILYGFHLSGVIQAYDPLSGKVLYKSLNSEGQSLFVASGTIQDGKIFMGGSDHIYALRTLK